jgi:hypothetical protein
MTSIQEDDKPWKTDLARKSKQRRELVLQEVEETVRKAGSFEDALRQAVEIMKKRFARYSAITAYVADGEDLAAHTTLDRPAGPERVGSTGGPLAEAAQGHGATVVSDLAANAGWAAVGLSTGSAMVAPVRRALVPQPAVTSSQSAPICRCALNSWMAAPGTSVVRMVSPSTMGEPMSRQTTPSSMRFAASMRPPTSPVLAWV